MVLVHLALGSNIPPKETHICEAVDLLKIFYPMEFSFSSIYKTNPFHNKLQSEYLNCSVRYKTAESATRILNNIQKVEKKIGRVRTEEKWGSRIIDIDLVFYGDEIIDEKQITVPHYDLLNRDFFIIPLLELTPNLVDPKSGIELKKALNCIPKQLRTYPGKFLNL